MPEGRKKIPLIWKIAIGFVLGILAGAVLKDKAQVLAPVGKVFITLLKILIVPLVFSSLVVGTASLGDPRKLGRIGAKTIGFYLVTTAVAIVIGLILGNVMQPGSGMALSVDTSGFKAPVPPSVTDVLIGIFPDNIAKSLAEANMLQIIVFALFFGVAAVLAGEKGKPVINLMDSVAEAMYKLTGMVMAFAPYGVFALIATTVAKYGLSVLAPFAKVIFAVYLGCILHAVLIYSGLIMVFVKKSPLWYFSGVKESMLTAFVTRSSSATLPVTMRVAQENLGVSEGIASFVLPLGATINQNGTALYQAVAAVFIAQIYGLPLTLAGQATIVLMATLASIGTAGVPSAGTVTLTMILAAINVPLEGLALILAVDRLPDMLRTVGNVLGDAAAAVVVAKSERLREEKRC